MEFLSKSINSFIAVAQEGSITKAAERLCITPSPLSKKIMELEEGLNIKLFERTSQGLSLTKEGKCLYDDVIVNYEKLNNIRRSYKENTHFQVGVYGPLPPHINMIINHLITKNNKIHINFISLRHDDLERRAEINRLDLLFSIEKLPFSPFSNYMSLEDKQILLHPLGLGSEQCKTLPWMQSSLFAETSIFKIIHMKFQQEGFSPALMNIDDPQLLYKLIILGKGISLSLESIQNVMRSSVYDVVLLENMNITHHIYTNIVGLKNIDLANLLSDCR
jgi:DNA-binding transcriptional LysR family regulator